MFFSYYWFRKCLWWWRFRSWLRVCLLWCVVGGRVFIVKIYVGCYRLVFCENKFWWIIILRIFILYIERVLSVILVDVFRYVGKMCLFICFFCLRVIRIFLFFIFWIISYKMYRFKTRFRMEFGIGLFFRRILIYRMSEIYNLLKREYFKRIK